MQGRGSARLTGTMVHVPQGGPPLGCHAAPRPTQGGEDEGRGTGESRLRSPPGACEARHPVACPCN